MGGALNLLPKRAGNDPLTRVSAGWGSGGQSQVALDVGRRFGDEDRLGVRLNAARHGGGSSVGGATWLDAKQVDTGDPATDGKRTIGVPRLQANMGVEWDLPWAAGLTADGRVVYTGSSYADARNTQEVPGWTRLDVGRTVSLNASVEF